MNSEEIDLLIQKASNNILLPYKVIPGVYVLNNNYIGQSLNIRKRIKQHIYQSLSGTHYNKGILDTFYDSIKNDNFKITILSNDINDEFKWYSTYIHENLYLVNSHEYRLCLGYKNFKFFHEVEKKFPRKKHKNVGIDYDKWIIDTAYYYTSHKDEFYNLK